MRTTAEAEIEQMIAIEPDKACYFILLARKYQAKYGVVIPDPASDMTDDNAREVLEDYESDPVDQELKDFLGGLNVDEMASLLALMWIGRGDYAKEQWDEALDEARRIEDAKAPEYLISTPLAPDYVEETLTGYGYSCEEMDRDHL